MKTRNMILSAVVLLMTVPSLMAAEIKFEHSSWAEVQKKARAQNKMIFVDFYATWCGPCKYMSREVFTNEEVGAFFNRNFISYKVDAENEELALVESINLEAYPTLVFFDADGNIVFRHVGAADEKALLALGEIVSAYKKNEGLLRQGKATQQQAFEYLAIARVANPEQYEALAPAYISKLTTDDLIFADAWKMVTGAVSDIHHPLFQEIVANAASLHEAHGDSFVQFVDGVLSAHFEAMVQANNVEGLEIYKRSMQILFREVLGEDRAYEFFDLETNVKFYLQREQTDRYAETLVSLVEGYLMADAAKLAEYSLELSSTVKRDPFKGKAIAWAVRSTELDNNKGSVYNLARVYAQLGEKDQAVACAKTLFSFELSEDEKTFVSEYLKELES